MYFMVAMDLNGMLFILTSKESWDKIYNEAAYPAKAFQTGDVWPRRPIWAVDMYAVNPVTLEPVECHV